MKPGIVKKSCKGFTYIENKKRERQLEPREDEGYVI